MLLAFLAVAGVAQADGVRVAPTMRPRIVNGLDTHAYPTTGAMLYYPAGAITDDNASIYCSGTLIGCETFVVAAHCAADVDPSHYAVYLQHAGIVPVVAVTRHPLYIDADFPKHDVAVLKLGATITGITPSAIAATAPAQLLPLSGTIVGFGQTHSGASDYGIKRVGGVLAESCPGDSPGRRERYRRGLLELPGGAGTGRHGLEHLQRRLGRPAVSRSRRRPGAGRGDLRRHDPQLPRRRHRVRRQRVHEPQLHPRSTRHRQHGCVRRLGTGRRAYDVGRRARRHARRVACVGCVHGDRPAGANTLRITLNGKDDGVFNPDLYVKAGLGASTTVMIAPLTAPARLARVPSICPRPARGRLPSRGIPAPATIS
jgi:hypothetical protein